jgi:IS30 family transposase
METKGDLTRAERLEIGILLQKGYSQRSIAKSLGRGHNTVSYEIAHNSVASVYDPLKADAKARLRKRMRKLEWSKIEKLPNLKKFIVEKLKARWNPDEIAGFLERTKEHPYVSKTAIYAWLRTARGERYCRYLYSKRKRIKKRKPKAKKILIPNRVGIERRFQGATNRTRYKHWEDDTIVGKKGTPGGLKVGYERKAKLVLAHKVESMRPNEHAAVERRWFREMEALSVTRDNGIENRDHESVGVPGFFCDAYSSWQKGGVENVNKMLRSSFPKGTDFSTVTQKEVDDACAIINAKPRKSLGYRSALEVATKAKLFKNTSVLIQG